MPALIALVKDRHWHQLEPLQQIYRKYGYVLIIYDIYIYSYKIFVFISGRCPLPCVNASSLSTSTRPSMLAPSTGQYGEAGELDRFRRQGRQTDSSGEGKKEVCFIDLWIFVLAR